MAPSAALAALLLVTLLAGCVEITADDIDLNVQPTATPTEATTPRTAGMNSTAPVTDITLTLEDLRPDPLAPNGSLLVQASFRTQTPLPEGATLHIAHRVGEEEPKGEDLPFNASQPSGQRTFHIDVTPGPHQLRVAIGWRPAPEAPVVSVNESTLDLVVMDRLTVVLDAEKRWHDDQKAFHTTLTVPFAPWDEESAYDILMRTAERSGFAVEAHYDEALDSYYIEAINGTKETWATGNTWSYSWMVHLDGKETRSAADDTRPAPDQTLSYRYLKCYTTGRCTDGEV
ncbi:MAG: hypothetical protein KY455_10870 [Euryarchaeota archaeon]|nr:hypothetical protein [Euryarchaeota archaeon]